MTALNQTITAGDQGGSITSETLHDMIQTNANIVSGDSGGPLANSAGQVIGMDTAGNDGGFSVQGQGSTGYAIPIDNALAVARQIAQRQASSTVNIGYPPFMGIFIGQGSNSNPQAQAEAAGGGYQNPFGGFGGNGNGMAAATAARVATAATAAWGPAEHRQCQLGHLDPRDDLRRPGRDGGLDRWVGHHRGERPGRRLPGQPDQRRVEVPPR